MHSGHEETDLLTADGKCLPKDRFFSVASQQNEWIAGVTDPDGKEKNFPPQNGRKILQIVFEKGLVSRIYKEHI